MNTLIAVCIVIVTVALVAVAVAAIRAVSRFSEAVDGAAKTTTALTALLEDATRTSAEIRGLAVSLEDVSKRLSEPATRIGEVGARVASISSGLLDEVESPVRRAVSIVRTLRAVAGALAGTGRGRSDGITERIEENIETEAGNRGT